jgi:hypothetical protein
MQDLAILFGCQHGPVVFTVESRPARALLRRWTRKRSAWLLKHTRRCALLDSKAEEGRPVEEEGGCVQNRLGWTVDLTTKLSQSRYTPFGLISWFAYLNVSEKS